MNTVWRVGEISGGLAYDNTFNVTFRVPLEKRKPLKSCYPDDIVFFRLKQER